MATQLVTPEQRSSELWMADLSASTRVFTSRESMVYRLDKPLPKEASVITVELDRAITANAGDAVWLDSDAYVDLSIEHSSDQVEWSEYVSFFSYGGIVVERSREQPVFSYTFNRKGLKPYIQVVVTSRKAQKLILPRLYIGIDNGNRTG